VHGLGFLGVGPRLLLSGAAADRDRMDRTGGWALGDDSADHPLHGPHALWLPSVGLLDGLVFPCVSDLSREETKDMFGRSVFVVLCRHVDPLFGLFISLPSGVDLARDDRRPSPRRGISVFRVFVDAVESGPDKPLGRSIVSDLLVGPRPCAPGDTVGGPGPGRMANDFGLSRHYLADTRYSEMEHGDGSVLSPHRRTAGL